MATDKKYVYLFSEGKKEMKSLLGGKGANLAEMTHIGLPVPQGLTITTECCNEYLAAGESFPPGLEDQLNEKLAALEQITGKNSGTTTTPAGFCTLRGTGFHARHDGHYFEPGVK